MGQKVNPHGLRVGVIKDWDSKWYAGADFAEADTTYGKTGVKVWIYRGEILPTKAAKEGSDK